MSVEELYKNTKPHQAMLIGDISQAIRERCKEGPYTSIEIVGALVWCILDEYELCREMQDDN